MTRVLYIARINNVGSVLLMMTNKEADGKKSVLRHLLSITWLSALFSVKLIGGPSPKEGMVQVYYNNIWGSVCDQMWDAKDADVVCRTLGYTGSTQPNNDAHYGQGSATIWLNNVQCAGNESSILSCAHDGLKMHTCANGNKANVSCVGTHGNNAFWLPIYVVDLNKTNLYWNLF